MGWLKHSWVEKEYKVKIRADARHTWHYPDHRTFTGKGANAEINHWRRRGWKAIRVRA